MLAKRILAEARYWASNAVFSAACRAEVNALLASGNADELRARFQHPLRFGTGGMRGVVGFGTSRLNIYNVRRSSCAVGRYLLRSHQQTPSIIISYDTRLHSRQFAVASCEVFAALGIAVHLTQECRPVPLLSYAVRKLNCQAGVCITASHNPPDNNGYKVYWQHGGQVVPPHDKAIMDIYDTLVRYEEIPHIPYSQALQAGMIKEHGQELDEHYLNTLADLARRTLPDVAAVYTPLHGTGATLVPQALQQLGFGKIVVVAAQAPDGNFPTVVSPNPENPQALRLAVAEAEKIGAQLVLGNDPDADRLGMMVKTDDGYKHLSGNEMVCVMLEMRLATLQREDRLPPHALVVRTIVTSRMVDAIATSYGVECQATLPGFKWIGQLIEDYEQGKRAPYKRFIFGCEDSYGLLGSDALRDKDGVAACCLALQISCQLEAAGKTWHQMLEELYAKHGWHQHKTLSYPNDKDVSLLAKLRQEPTLLGKLRWVEDYRTGSRELYDGCTTSTAREELSLPRSDILQLYLTDASIVTIRPSGTEPLLKCYIAVKGASKDECDTKTAELVAKIQALL
ncbi:MAG: phospho-sugar mutase [Pseudomonadota bacterium]|nr:phospho-sugar mutase [Pseudomonadota bacterium]